MFVSFFLKRALPFILTLMLGAMLGNFFNLFGGRADYGAGMRSRRRHYGCSHSRMRLRAQQQFAPAVSIYEPNTRYTKAAWEHGITGVVRLRVSINRQGSVTNVETIEGLPYGLTEEAQKVAWQTRFTPAMSDGEPTATTRELSYTFSLSDRMAAGL